MNDYNFNIYNIIIFSGVVQGLIFSFIILFHKKYKSKTNNFIALTVLALSLSNLQYWLMDIDSNGTFSVFNNFRFPSDTFIVPAFFLYVNSYLQNRVRNKIIFLLTIPLLISLVFNVLLLNTNFFSNDSSITINITLEVFSLIFNLALIILIFKKIKNYENRNYDRTRVTVKTKWLKQLLIIGGIICVFWFAEIMYAQGENKVGLSIYYPLWISISFLVYWISYVGVFHSKLYNERILIRKSGIKAEASIRAKKYSIKKTNPKLFAEISEWVIGNKMYLNPDLNLNKVAEEFNISSGYVSQLLGSHSALNFNDYVNTLRVDDAKKMLIDAEYNKYTIMAIGLESGFNSKSSFYTAFKKFTGKTPLEYKMSPK